MYQKLNEFEKQNDKIAMTHLANTIMSKESDISTHLKQSMKMQILYYSHFARTKQEGSLLLICIFLFGITNQMDSF